MATENSRSGWRVKLASFPKTLCPSLEAVEPCQGMELADREVRHGLVDERIQISVVDFSMLVSSSSSGLTAPFPGIR